jgi:hypothetical protein
LDYSPFRNGFVIMHWGIIQWWLKSPPPPPIPQLLVGNQCWKQIYTVVDVYIFPL